MIKGQGIFQLYLFYYHGSEGRGLGRKGSAWNKMFADRHRRFLVKVRLAFASRLIRLT